MLSIGAESNASIVIESETDDATLLLMSPATHESRIKLAHPTGANFSIVNQGLEGRFAITDDNGHDLFRISSQHPSVGMIEIPGETLMRQTVTM
jgi:hypothetical protein